MRKWRKLEDRPSQLRDLRELLAKRVGAPLDPSRRSMWARLVEWWKRRGSPR
jgi:hypothetical protein